MLNNYQSIAGLVDQLLTSLTNVVNNPSLFRNQVVQTLKCAVPVLLNFAVSQLGLSKLPSEVKSAVQFVPNKIYGLLRAAVSKATLPGATSGKLYQGALTDVLPIGDNYQLWEARDDHGKAHVKVAKKNAQGQFVLFAELNEASFSTAASKEHIRNLIEAAKAYSAELERQKKTPTPDGKELLKSKQAAVSALQNLVKTDIEQDACAALGVGCFAAGTKLWTPDGFRNIEDIQPNELVFARNEYDPSGPIEAKIVDEKFERTGRILHLHLQGERGSVSSLIIRTTPEHPFYVRERGWTEAGALQAGDGIRTDSGWVKVEEVFDTGEYAKVYNLRVADWHTYFVGEGSAAWAHNSYGAVLEVIDNELNTELTDRDQRINGLVEIHKVSRRSEAMLLSASDFAKNLREGLQLIGVRGRISESVIAQIRKDITSASRCTATVVFEDLINQGGLSSADKTIVEAAKKLAKLSVKGYATNLGLDNFKNELQQQLRTLKILSATETFAAGQAAYDAALEHGNAGRTPFAYWDSSTASNPYTAGTRNYDYWNRIKALADAGIPGAAEMFASLKHPTQRFGIPYQLDRAEYYKNQGLLVGIEVRTTSSLGNGYVDLMLSGGKAIECKAWTGFASYPDWQQLRMIEQLTQAIVKYLASSNVQELVIEFRGQVPLRVQAILAGVNCPSGKTFSFYATN